MISSLKVWPSLAALASLFEDTLLAKDCECYFSANWSLFRSPTPRPMFDAVSLCVWTAADWAELCLTGEKYLDSSTCGGVGIGVAACTGTVAFLLESEVLLF